MQLHHQGDLHVLHACTLACLTSNCLRIPRLWNHWSIRTWISPYTNMKWFVWQRENYTMISVSLSLCLFHNGEIRINIEILLVRGFPWRSKFPMFCWFWNFDSSEVSPLFSLEGMPKKGFLSSFFLHSLFVFRNGHWVLWTTLTSFDLSHVMACLQWWNECGLRCE